MNQKLPEVYRSLQRAKEAAERRLVEIDTEQREIKASLKSLNAALRALGSPEQSATGTKKKAATTAEVIAMVTEVLSSVEEMSLEQLAKYVGEKLLAMGKSRNGLRLRLEQAVRDSRFSRTNKGFRLRIDPPSAPTQVQNPGSP
jgi:hypothetical protein